MPEITRSTSVTPTQGARVRHSVAQNIPDSVLTVLAFDTELYDTDSIHDPANNSRLTCQTAGKYAINSCVQFTTNLSGHRWVYIRLNGVTCIASVQRSPEPGFGIAAMTVSTVWDLMAGDYLEIVAYQTGGGGIDAIASYGQMPNFSMQRIG